MALCLPPTSGSSSSAAVIRKKVGGGVGEKKKSGLAGVGGTGGRGVSGAVVVCFSPFYFVMRERERVCVCVGERYEERRRSFC